MARQQRVVGLRARAVVIGAGVFTVLAATATTAAAAPGGGEESGHRAVTVMTYNLDEGTDFGPIFGATTVTEFVKAANDTLAEVVASDIPGRAAQVADLIAASRPDLVSIQEAAVWTSPAGTINALASLQQRLAADGAHYVAASILDEFQSPPQIAQITPISFVDRDALLVRSDLPSHDLRIANVQARHFATLLPFSILGISVAVTRGWISADATVRGRTVRFIATHLESFYAPVQEAQGQELLHGPATTSLPVILAGDLNTGPLLSGGFLTPTYGQLLAGGFVDTWPATRRSPGMTNAFHAEDPYGPSTADKRIDLVLVKGDLEPVTDRLVGTTPSPTTGLWPSDHAGVVSRIRLASCPPDGGDGQHQGAAQTRCDD